MESIMPKHKPPSGLGDRALELWNGIANSASYSLRIDELLILTDACREVDLIDRMEREQGRGELTATGSQGQPVAAPLIAELRQHRSMVANLMKQLKLPGSGDGRTQQSTTEKARMAANARWGNTA